VGSPLRHLTEGELAGYLDRDLSATERQSVERHLDECDLCRAELVAVAGLVDGWNASDARSEPPSVPGRFSKRRPWRRSMGLVGLAAAAALAGLLLVVPGPEPLADGGWDRERIGTEGVAPLRTHAPSDAGTVSRHDLRFTWADHGTDSYRLTMTAEDGGLVWSVTLADTMAVPPDTLQLEPGARFFWYVDAMSAGVVARSGVRSFTVTP
jgi:predicted anti-sigma-YlaC factor YlaD